MDNLSKLYECEGFEWDPGNQNKIWLKHSVSQVECEQLFFNKPLVVGDDERHSEKEQRYHSLGVTDGGRRLFVVFTIRKSRLRVISARDMSKKERKAFNEHEENS